MSHIGKKPIDLPEGVQVTLEGKLVKVKGPKGELQFLVPREVEVRMREQQIICEQARPGREAHALWGTTRARVANMVEGVSKGFQKKLELKGVGYRAKVGTGELELSVGYSHPVKIKAPEGISFTVDKEEITVEGIDNQLVGQIAANVRSVRKPEPYKGKGIRYQGEKVKRKVGKVVGATT